MRGLPLLATQVGFENKAFWRNPAAAFFTFIFPIMFLVLLTGLFTDEVDIYGPPTSAATFFTPAIASFAVISASFTNLAITVSFNRDEGVLKRVRGTPLRPSTYMASRVIHSTVIALVLMAVVTLFGAVFYGVDVPTETAPALIVSVVIGAGAFCALGLALTSIIPNADAAPPIVNAVVIPLSFISGMFVPLDDPPKWIEVIGNIFPFKHFADAMKAAFDPFATGSGFEWADLAVVAAWGLVGIVLAIRYFSWEPRR